MLRTKTQKIAAMGAVSVALVTGMGSPASAGGSAGPYRIHSTGSGSHSTPHRQASSSAQICFNTWGSSLSSGYKVSMYRNALPSPTLLWSATYYGAKNSTCSPWKSTSGEFYAVLSGPASATGDVWLYWN